MNILNLQVSIKAIHIGQNSQQLLAFSLRLGAVLSPITQSYPHTSHPSHNIDLALSCDESALHANSRVHYILIQACLVVYSVSRDGEGEKNICGMVFIPINNKEKEGEIGQYKIQQSVDPNAYISLTYRVNSLEIKSRDRENQSQASKSSYADVREFHKVLSKDQANDHDNDHYNDNDNKDEESCNQFEDFEVTMKKNKDNNNNNYNYRNKNKNKNKHKRRLSPQHKEFRENQEEHKIHIKSEETFPFGEEIDPSYVILLKKAERELVKEREKCNSLVNILAIEEERSREAQKFIQLLMKKINKKQCHSKENLKSLTPSKSKQNLLQKMNQNQNSPINDFQLQGNTDKNERYVTLVRQRDELYEVAQDLHEKNNNFKRENEDLKRNIKIMQNQMIVYEEEIEELKNENVELKEKIFDFCNEKYESKDDSLRISRLAEKVRELENQNSQKERRIRESIKGMQEFRNDALRANEDLISRDQEIKLLREQLQNLKDLLEQTGIKSRGESYSLSLIEEKQMNNDRRMETFENLLSLLKRNISSRNKQFQKLETISTKNHEKTLKNFSHIPFLKNLKDKFIAFYDKLKKNKREKISIIEMRQIMLKILYEAEGEQLRK